MWQFPYCPSYRTSPHWQTYGIRYSGPAILFLSQTQPEIFSFNVVALIGTMNSMLNDDKFRSRLTSQTLQVPWQWNLWTQTRQRELPQGISYSIQMTVKYRSVNNLLAFKLYDTVSDCLVVLCAGDRLFFSYTYNLVWRLPEWRWV